MLAGQLGGFEQLDDMQIDVGEETQRGSPERTTRKAGKLGCSCLPPYVSLTILYALDIMDTNQSLLASIGGACVVDKLMNDFYSKVYNDEILGKWFVDAPKHNLALSRILNFTNTVVIGAHESYYHKKLRVSHTDMVHGGLGDKEFDRMKQLFLDVLSGLCSDATVKARVEERLEATRNSVLNRVVCPRS